MDERGADALAAIRRRIRPAPIDGGIVMAHLALASAALGHEREWKVQWGDAALAQECGVPPDVISVATM